MSYLQYFFGSVVGVGGIQLNFGQRYVGIAAGDDMVFTLAAQNKTVTLCYHHELTIVSLSQTML